MDAMAIKSINISEAFCGCLFSPVGQQKPRLALAQRMILAFVRRWIRNNILTSKMRKDSTEMAGSVQSDQRDWRSSFLSLQQEKFASENDRYGVILLQMLFLGSCMAQQFSIDFVPKKNLFPSLFGGMATGFWEIICFRRFRMAQVLSFFGRGNQMSEVVLNTQFFKVSGWMLTDDRTNTNWIQFVGRKIWSKCHPVT